MKICNKCNAEKDESLFCVDKSSNSGFASFCKECKNAEGRKRYRETVDPVKHRARIKKWASENRERLNELNRASHQKRRESRNAYSRSYRERNLAHMRELGKAWSKNNPEKYRVTLALRRAKKRSATPAWAKSEWDSFVMREMYDLAIRRTKCTGIEWHVDHIVPLKSKLVCGLHCSANLQVIPATVNHSKGNRTWPDMPQ